MSTAYYPQPQNPQTSRLGSYSPQTLHPTPAPYRTSPSPAYPQQDYVWPPTTPAAKYVCLYPHCAGAGFPRYADLQRHIAVIHARAVLVLVDCSFPGCARRGQCGFTRKDKMVDHLRDVHKADIPKRAAGGRKGST